MRALLPGPAATLTLRPTGYSLSHTSTPPTPASRPRSPRTLSSYALNGPLSPTPSSSHPSTQPAAAMPTKLWPQELDEQFSELRTDAAGMFTVAGFGSLLSERSARSTFPNLKNFRPGRVVGWRRVFAHTADIFFLRGIARPETGEIASLSCEPCPGQHLVVSLFEVEHSPEAVRAFIAREHEFCFCAVQPLTLDRRPAGVHAVLCARSTDDHYRAARCPPAEFARRWAAHGVERVWRDDVLPCRVYLRHCVLAAAGFHPEARDSFLDNTFLADRTTTVRQYLQLHPDIMQELPPPELAERYSG